MSTTQACLDMALQASGYAGFEQRCAEARTCTNADTIPCLATVVSAVEDALSGYGVTVNEYPLSPERIVELME